MGDNRLRSGLIQTKLQLQKQSSPGYTAIQELKYTRNSMKSLVQHSTIHEVQNKFYKPHSKCWFGKTKGTDKANYKRKKHSVK